MYPDRSIDMIQGIISKFSLWENDLPSHPPYSVISYSKTFTNKSNALKKDVNQSPLILFIYSHVHQSFR